MNDLLLSISQNSLARSVIRRTHLPIPLPPLLQRSIESWSEQMLSRRRYIVGGRPGGGLREAAMNHILAAGAALQTIDGEVDGLVFDASTLTRVDELQEMYEFFHQYLRRIKVSGRVVLISQIPLAAGHAGISAVQESVTGFTRSLAKELGPKGITVNMLEIHDRAALAGVLRFFLSDHSAYVSGQVLVSGRPEVGNPTFQNILKERTILITGAARGIGAATARKLAEEGAKVLLLDHPSEVAALEELARSIHGVPLAIDLASVDATTIILKRLWELAPIHGIIHNAGITRDKTLGRMNSDQWSQVLNINLQVPVALTELVLDEKNEQLLAKDAAFVFLSSIGGIAGNVGQTNYAATKAGLIGYARGLAARHFSSGLRFNCVAPGFIETKMTAAMPFAMREIARRLNSLKQGGIPDDVAEAVTFLVSPASVGVTGQTLRVCGQSLVGA